MLGCCFPQLRGAPDATSMSLARGERRAQHPGVSSSVFQRKSWKRRYFVLDEFSISYYKCEQVSGPNPACVRLLLEQSPGDRGAPRHTPAPAALRGAPAHRGLLSSPQDKEPLRSILLKDVCKTHECLVKSG